jgi:uncharacterized protein (TIGR02001 family)
MKKLALLATALTVVSGSAMAADMYTKAAKAPPPPAYDPWDFAFGAAIMNDYIFRGVTQSNHKPSVAAYFEPRYNVTKELQLYIGASGESISFPNRAAAEIDIYGGIRPTVGMFAFDFGVWGYLYPGGQCFNAFAVPGSGIPGSDANCAVSPAGNSDPFTLGLPINGNFAKKSASFYEGYAKVNITLNDQFAVGINEYYSPNFLNLGAWGNYASLPRRCSAPLASACTSPANSAVSGSALPTRSTARRLPARLAAAHSRAVFLSRATTPGTSASASPTRCSRSTFVTPTPTCRRVTATPSPAITPPGSTAASRRSIRAASAPTGAAPPVSPSSRLT